jgi:Protein of Unknown function (DUF2784)
MYQRIAADFVVALHIVFILWVVLGSLTLLKHRGLVLAHLPALAWACYVEFTGRYCPLTPLENYFRRLAGEAGYSGGFIEHYAIRVIYPDGLSRRTQLALGVALLVFNATIYLIAFLRRRRPATVRELPPSP